MRPPQNKLATIVAFAIAGVAICLLFFVVDPTPLVVDPKPSLDFPIAIVAILIGLWSARHITCLPSLANKRLGRWALWIMLPIWLGFGLTSLAARLQELNSFRAGTTTEEAMALIVEKEGSSGGRFHSVTVMSLADQRTVRIRVDRATFEKVKPNVSCARLLLQRAPDGAVRLIKPLSWSVPCSQR